MDVWQAGQGDAPALTEAQVDSLLMLFNLLPIPPLDGGLERGRRRLRPEIHDQLAGRDGHGDLVGDGGVQLAAHANHDGVAVDRDGAEFPTDTRVDAAPRMAAPSPGR